MNKTILYLVRHGETHWNVQKRFQGHAPNSINETGQNQADKLKAKLENIAFDEIYSSDLPRAFHTAQIIFPEKEIKKDKELRERYLGLWEGKLYSEIEEISPEFYGNFSKTYELHLSSRGESFSFFENRAMDVLKKIAEDNLGKTVAVVTHGGILRSLYRTIHEIPMDKIHDFAFNNTGLNILEFDLAKKEFEWQVHNDTSHLDN